MSLPIKAIDRLFERLGLTYGSQWSRMWEGVPIAEVKSSWAHELASYAKPERMAAIVWALDNLPERCPNAIEFRNLCRRAPMPEAPKLPEPKADPERLKVELAKLREPAVQAARAVSFGDGKEWARRILGRFESGERLNATTLRFAREALKGGAHAEQ